ncbi:MAG: thiol-disulfide oxidoreductase DCC family protein [Bacteroidetes bacterium]|nr:MAG: thiol-disulfide oxidoreductase DCC family protein [Bacteroidota bacterium]
MNILLFDGVCNLCNGTVQFIIKRDKKARFRFASLQSDKGQALLQEHNLPTREFDSVIYIRNGKCYQKSTAALYIMRDLGGFWQIFFPLIIVPPFLRNAVYSLIARNRYRWFGRQESCMLPTPELKSRFL